MHSCRSQHVAFLHFEITCSLSFNQVRHSCLVKSGYIFFCCSLSFFPLLGPTPPQSFFDSDVVDIAIIFVPPMTPRTKKQGQSIQVGTTAMKTKRKGNWLRLGGVNNEKKGQREKKKWTRGEVKRPRSRAEPGKKKKWKTLTPHSAMIGSWCSQGEKGPAD